MSESTERAVHRKSWHRSASPRTQRPWHEPRSNSWASADMAGMDYIQCSEDTRRAARRRLPRMLFDFIDGGAGEERASRRNRDALARIELLPRVLVNVEARQVGCDLLGRRWGLPFGIAPMGMCDLAWPGADRAFGDAARDFFDPALPVDRCFHLARGLPRPCRGERLVPALRQCAGDRLGAGAAHPRRRLRASGAHRRHAGALPAAPGAAPRVQSAVPIRSFADSGLRPSPRAGRWKR